MVTATAMGASLLHIGIFGDAVRGLGSWTKDDLIAPLLILVLGMALGIGLVFLFLIAHFLRQGSNVNTAAPRPRETKARWSRSEFLLCATPTRWLAVRATKPRLVLETLGLIRVTPCSWEDGLHAAQDQKLFVSPSIKGWVLVMGSALPDPAEDVDRCFRLVHACSRKLGWVQFFSFNRAVNHHAWALACDGRVLRAYAWAGKTLWNQGRLTREETELGIHCFGYADETEGLDLTEARAVMSNTERLPLLAARWSVDPSAVDPRWLRQHQGLTGEVSRFIPS